MPAVIVLCPRCKDSVAVPEELSGRWVTCSSCGMQFAAFTSPSDRPTHSPMILPERSPRAWMKLGWILTTATGIVAAILILFAVAQLQVSEPSASTTSPAPSAIAQAGDRGREPRPAISEEAQDEPSDWDELPAIPPPAWLPEMPPDPAPALLPDIPREEPRPRRVRPTRDLAPEPAEAIPAENPPPASAVDRAVLNRLNVHRKLVGIGPVTLDAALSEGCIAHARYLVRNQGNPSLNGLGVHGESSNLPGYSKSGATAAPARS